MKSIFLERFNRLRTSGADLMKVYGDILIVEGHAQEETKTAGGIIIQSHDRQKDGFGQNAPAFYTVLYVGEGYYSEDEDGNEKAVPLDVQVGDVILTGTQSVRPLSKFGPIISTKDHGLFLTRVEDIQIRFPGGQGSYEKAAALLQDERNLS